MIDFTIRNQQCKNCEASYAQGAWHAVVQVRQRVSHKRTFYFLEQVILKHDAHSDCIRIVVRTHYIHTYIHIYIHTNMSAHSNTSTACGIILNYDTMIFVCKVKTCFMVDFSRWNGFLLQGQEPSDAIQRVPHLPRPCESQVLS